MNKKTEYSDFFDDNFEVTYDADNDDSFVYTGDMISESSRNPRSSRVCKQSDSVYKEPKEPIYRKQRKNRKGVPLAAPIRKGGRVLSRFAQALVRSLTVVLILAVIIYVSWTFFRASAPYGDIENAVRTQEISQTLAAYLFLPAVFLLFEFISLLWSITRVHVRNGRDSWKEDTGRGLFSFVAVFAMSYLSFLFSSFLPESPEILTGIKGALDVYGSMHNVLFGLCAAGVASCIIRKYV